MKVIVNQELKLALFELSGKRVEFSYENGRFWHVHARVLKPRLNNQAFSSNIVLDEAAERPNILYDQQCLIV